MKNILLFILWGVCISAKCDTIDIWYIYYDNVKKIQCSEGIEEYCKLNLNKGALKDNDTIKIYCSRDAPCSDCINSLYVKSSSGHELYFMKAQEGNALTIPVQVLIESNFSSLNIYFKRGLPNEKDSTPRKILTINIE